MLESRYFGEAKWIISKELKDECWEANVKVVPLDLQLPLARSEPLESCRSYPARTPVKQVAPLPPESVAWPPKCCEKEKKKEIISLLPFIPPMSARKRRNYAEMDTVVVFHSVDRQRA